MAVVADNDNDDNRRISEHPLLQVSDALVPHIHDWPSLMCLAMTCRVFYHRIVHTHRLWFRTAFDNLEVHRTEGGEEDDCGVFHGGRVHKTCRSVHPYPWCHGSRDNSYPDGELLDPERRGRTAVNHDLFRWWTYGRLRTQDWLPCYSCRRIRHRHTAFFADQTRCVFDVLQPRCGERRCIDCSIHEPIRFMEEYWEHLPRRRRNVPRRHRRPGRFLLDMPRRLPGWRQRCTNCRAVEWVAGKPRKAQRLKKLCDACYARSLEDGRVTPEEIFAAEWTRLAVVEVQIATSDIYVDDVSDNDDDEEQDDDCDEEPHTLPIEVRNRYEILLIVDGT